MFLPSGLGQPISVVYSLVAAALTAQLLGVQSGTKLAWVH
jgi:hypothetical protein